MQTKIKFIVLISIILSIFSSAMVSAAIVGDTVNFQVNLQCAKTVDTDLGDGSATYLYYDYNLKDPDTIVRSSLSLTLTNDNPKIVTVPFTVNKPGYWTLEGNMYYLEFSWNGSMFMVTDSGICDAETYSEVIDSVPQQCGNNVQEGTEDCDGIDLAGNDCTDLGFGSGVLACDGSCAFNTAGCVALPSCGNTIVEAGEQCDDGNFNNHDDCLNTCQSPSCGDGYLWSGNEQCDDGNIDNGDGCDATCSFEGGAQCFAPIDVMLVIDRSGSMISAPDPLRLQNAKTAAITFVNNLNFSKDTAGLASFNQIATLDQPLTYNSATLINKINALAGVGQTNIGDSLKVAREELVANGGTTKALILLSDGAPNAMSLPNGSIVFCFIDPVSHTNCTLYSLNQSNITKDAGIEVFTIGLGVNNFTEGLLQEIATSPANYYSAPTSEDLEAIYLQIAQELCPCDGFDCSINSDDCNIGACNVQTDQCEFAPKVLSTSCEEDADKCTTQHCDGAGACEVNDTVVVPADDVCQSFFCDSADGIVKPTPFALSTPCNTDNNLCTTQHCDGAGVCEVNDTVVVPADDVCQSFFCDSADGIVKTTPFVWSTPCEADSSLCTIDHCDGAGSCVNLNNVDCTGLDTQCQVGTCDSNTGSCFADYSSYPLSTPCQADSDQCTIDHCNAAGSCITYDNVPVPADAVCNSFYCDSADGLIKQDYTDYPLSTFCETDTNICTIQHCSGSGACVNNPEAELPPECDRTTEGDGKVSQSMPTANFGFGRYMIVNPKTAGRDRAYLRISATGYLGQQLSQADLSLAVYYTGGNVAGSAIDAYYCPDHSFQELFINWNNQPMDDACTLADTFIVPDAVVAGFPETWHTFDILAELNDELANGDGLFTIVLVSAEEGSVPDNSKYVQYLTKEYPDATYRPKLLIS